VGDNQVIRALALAAYHVTSQRPVDPNWDKRGRAVQQYELRVKRLDQRFREALDQTFNKAIQAGKWTGTAAIHDVVSYWGKGVLAYFDAAGQDAAPPDNPHPVATREALKQYDPDLFAIVDETMAYNGRVDWRFKP
jgi:hypothetical protein